MHAMLRLFLVALFLWPLAAAAEEPVLHVYNWSDYIAPDTIPNPFGLTTALMPKGYKARPEQVILFRIAAWDTNCPQHIPQKFDAADVATALAARDTRIAELEAELAALKGQPASVPAS